MPATTSMPFDDIEFHAQIVNPRESLKDIEDLMASIKAVGLQMPLAVLQRDEIDEETGESVTRYYLIAGFRRHEAIRRLREEQPGSFQMVEVKKHKCSIAEAQVINLTENIQRSELNSMEIARGVEILNNLGFPQNEIADKIGKSQTWVSNALNFQRRATPQLRDAVRSGEISYGLARNISTLEDSKQCKLVGDARQIYSLANASLEESDARAAMAKAEAKIRREVRESSGRAIRPTTVEIRDEVTKLAQEQSSLNEFDLGILVALSWTLGERKTLEKPK